jgi:hypothetical protein
MEYTHSHSHPHTHTHITLTLTLTHSRSLTPQIKFVSSLTSSNRSKNSFPLTTVSFMLRNILRGSTTQLTNSRDSQSNYGSVGISLYVSKPTRCRIAPKTLAYFTCGASKRSKFKRLTLANCYTRGMLLLLCKRNEID